MYVYICALQERRFKGAARIQRDIAIALTPEALKSLLSLADAVNPPGKSDAVFITDAESAQAPIRNFSHFLDNLEFSTRSIEVCLTLYRLLYILLANVTDNLKQWQNEFF